MEELVQPGELDPNEIQVPSAYVQRIFKGVAYEKRIEQLTLDEGSGDVEASLGPDRSRIVKRAAKEMQVLN